MNDSLHQKQKSRSWLGLFLAFIFLIFVGGSGLWFFLADRFEQMVDQQKDRLSRQQQTVICSNQQIRGYPFRLGIFCDTVEYADPQRQVKVKTGAVRTAAQFYAPGKVVAELDGPATIDMGPASAVTLNWDLMRSSIRANLDGIREISIAGTGLDLEIANPLRNTLTARQLELHARDAGENNLEAAFGALRLDVGSLLGTAIDPVTLTLELTAADLFDKVRHGPRLLQHIKEFGAAGTLTALNVEPENGGKLTIMGPWSLSNQGLITAELAIQLENPQKLLAFLQQILPDQTDQIAQIELALKAIGSTKPGNVQTIRLNIRENNISMGLIPLGNFPPIF